ncbi:MAG: phosphate ABC transporter substrate-binding protein [Myxococcales bacterium]|nr:phosphate ABC transporter substrate-binding protein [Myxococcales bacterium]
MGRAARALALFWALGGLAAAPAAHAKLRVNGSTTVNPVVSEAAAILRSEAGLEIEVDTVGGSSGGIAALADGRAEVGMSSRPLTERDAERFPGIDFHAVRVGVDAVALVVSRDVWESGVRCLGREQVRALYEGEIANWSALGGPDRRVAFFNKEPGRGTWEVFVQWLYGASERAPLVSLPEVGSNEEGRSKVASTRGAITVLSAAWADGERTFALGVCDAEGDEVRPTEAAIAAGRYPLARPLFIITDGAPQGAAKRLVDFILGARGQALVARHGYLPVGEGAQGVAAP